MHPGAKRGAVPFQFNPKEVTITKSAKWERKTTKGSKKAGPPEFTGPEPSKMTLEMFFDATATQDGSVVKAVETLLSCCVPTEESAGQKKPSPPLVVLHWGSISSFPAFVTSVSAKFTLFSSDGTPIRAVCSVSMEEMPGEEFRKQNPTSGSHEVRRVHRTVAGDSLASVAFAEYGDPTAWRALAAFNEIDDPLRVPTGTVLLLPTPEELAPAHGRCPMSITSTCLVEIDGKPLPADIAPLLVSAYVDDSQQLPGHVRAALPRSQPDGAGEVRSQGRLAGQGQRPGRRRRPARAADLRRGDRAGGRVRHRRHVHGDPRLRPDAPASSAAGGPPATSR